MTVNSTVVGIVAIPLLIVTYVAILTAAGSLSIVVPAQNIIVTLVLLLVPVAIGMAIRRWNANVGALVEMAGSGLGLVFIVLLLVTWVPRNWQFLLNTPASVFIGAIALGLLGFLFGYLFAKALKLHPRNARTIALETGIQNGPLAIAIVAFTFVGPLQSIQQQVMAVPALYSLFIVISSTVLTLWFRRANTAEEQKIPDALL
jgi:bile acid:Na+ symporter, BASS family